MPSNKKKTQAEILLYAKVKLSTIAYLRLNKEGDRLWYIRESIKDGSYTVNNLVTLNDCIVYVGDKIYDIVNKSTYTVTKKDILDLFDK